MEQVDKLALLSRAPHRCPVLPGVSVRLKNMALSSASVSLGALLMCWCKVKAFLKICFMGKCFLGPLEMGTGPESRCLYGGLTTAGSTGYEVPFLCVSQGTSQLGGRGRVGFVFTSPHEAPFL